AVFVFLVVLVAWGRVRTGQVGHALEQSAAAGRRCGGRTALRWWRRSRFRLAAFVRSAEHAAAAPGRTRLDRLVVLGQAARIEQELVLRRRFLRFVVACLGVALGVVGLESQFERIAIVALARIAPVAVRLGRSRCLRIAFDAGAAQRGIASAAMLAILIVRGRLGQPLVFLALVAGFVRRGRAKRGVSVLGVVRSLCFRVGA